MGLLSCRVDACTNQRVMPLGVGYYGRLVLTLMLMFDRSMKISFASEHLIRGIMLRPPLLSKRNRHFNHQSSACQQCQRAAVAF